MLCYCGRPAAVQLNDGAILCLEHYNERVRQMMQMLPFLFSMINYAQDQAAAMVGLPRIGPRLQIPAPPTIVRSAPVTMNTTNNIHVESGSQVGQINAGSIVYLDKAVSAFTGAGMKEIGDALQSFTQAVVDSKQIDAATQKEVLSLVQGIVEQFTKKKEERNPSIVKLAIQGIGTMVSAATLIEPHWDKLKHFFDALTH
jgi:hypothetical protein